MFYDMLILDFANKDGFDDDEYYDGVGVGNEYVGIHGEG